MVKVSVVLTIARSGPAGAHSRGDKIEVSVAEASRMRAAGQVEPLEGEALKAVEAFEAAQAETAAKGQAGAETATAKAATETATAKDGGETAAKAKPKPKPKPKAKG